jgi:hypothetical protein
VFRRNILHSNARIETEQYIWRSIQRGAVQDVVIENNIIRDADVGINVRGENKGVVIRGNRFERVREPLIGLNDEVFMHPAERLTSQLSGEKIIPSELLEAPAWQTAWSKLKNLENEDPLLPEVSDEVRTCQTKLAQAAALTISDGLSLELFHALTGLTIRESSSAELVSVLADGNGGYAKTQFTVSLPLWSIPIILSLKLPPLPGWQATTSRPVELKPGGSAVIDATLAIPAGVWGKPTIPLSCRVSGQGWNTNLSGTVQLAASSKTSPDIVNQWMVAGPFASDQPGEMGDTLYPPQLRLDIDAEYPGIDGTVRWQPVTDSKIDFTKLFGSPENGVAFAVSVLRVSRPVTVAFTTTRWSNVTLDGEPIGVPQSRSGNFKVSRTLTTGEHVVVCALPLRRHPRSGHINWELDMQVEVDPGSTPGVVRVVPVKEFSSISSLKLSEK